MKTRNIILTIAALIALPLCATSVIPMSVEQMTVISSHVIHARAVSSEARWNDQHTQIYTFTKFDTLDTWKGSSSRQFVVRQMGGRLDGLEQKVSGVRRFNNGDEAVLFLRPSEAGNGVLAVVGLFQGNFAVVQRGNEAVVSNGVPDAMQFDPATGKTDHYQSSRLTLSQLRNRVVSITGAR